MSDYDLLQFHAFCLTKTGSRLRQYATALSTRVRPGDLVLDLGAGSGLLALLACRAGARATYAIEAGDAIQYGRLLAASAGLSDRIEFIQSESGKASLPERVDVIVADIHDTFGLQANGLAALFDARDRFLKQGGVLVPRAMQLLVVPVDAHDLYAGEIDVWTRHVEGVDVSPLRSFAVNQLHPARLDRGNLLAEPAVITSIDFLTSTDLHASGVVTQTVTRDATMHGVCGCFISTLAEGIAMGNVPGENETTNFAQAFFPLDTPVSVSRGDRVSTRIDNHDGCIMRWRVEVARPDGSRIRFEHSTLAAALLSADVLRKQACGYRPTLTPSGEMERALLDRFDGGWSASDLERWLLERFGDLLPSAREAAAFLRATIERSG